MPLREVAQRRALVYDVWEAESLPGEEPIMRAAIVATTLTLALSGCASSDAGFPSLREAPRDTIANTDAAHWAAVEAEVTAAGQEVRSNPRSAPASATQSPGEFLDEAREDLDEARQSHEPN